MTYIIDKHPNAYLDSNGAIILEWTRDAPELPGYYWAIRKDEYTPGIVPIVVIKDGYFVTNLNLDELAYSEFKNFEWWMGPLPPPAPPENVVK